MTPESNDAQPARSHAAHGSASITYEQYQACLKEADERMKANNGHQYLHILKTRCMNCGRSPKVKTRCGGWLTTFVNILGCILQEKGVIVEKTPNVRISDRDQKPL